MKVGIVGHEGSKFTPETEERARRIIRLLLRGATLMVSGGCHLGGIDIWAEEEATAVGVPTLIFKPAKLQWEGGYKQRNLKIAENSDIVHCIVVRQLPPSYSGMRFTYCYHCKTNDHVKSGGCWTALRCPIRQWHVI